MVGVITVDIKEIVNIVAAVVRMAVKALIMMAGTGEPIVANSTEAAKITLHVALEAEIMTVQRQTIVTTDAHTVGAEAGVEVATQVKTRQ